MSNDELADRSFVVADDEPFSRDMLRSMLNQLRPRLVTTVANGVEALAALRADAAYYDCVITDFKMEPMNGLELLKTIRMGAPDIRRGLPVIMVTGHSGADLIGSALALDANGFLAKPISTATLWGRLKRVLSDVTPLRPAVAYSVIPTRAASVSGEPAPEPEREPVPQMPYAQALRPKVKPKPPTATPSRMSQPAAPSRAAASRAAAAAASPAPEPPPGVRMISCALKEVPAGAVLARDFTTRAGATLLTANNMLSQRLLARLRDLVDIDTVIDQIWIYEQESKP
jgi:two-component system chemotaxis response regulator CheY